MQVAIVHDDLVQWGGAERVLLGICEIFPNAPIYTTVFDKDNPVLQRNFRDKNIITSFLQNIPGWRQVYKALFPLHPIAFEQFDFSRFDLIISNTTRFAKSVITKPNTEHVCFIHTPPRFLWNFSGENGYFLGNLLFSKFRIYDRVSAQRVDCFIAGSKNAQKRISKTYRRDSKLIYPFIDLDRFENIETFNGGYFVVLGRLNRYKRADLAVEGCLKLNLPLKIIGDGPQRADLQKLVYQSGKMQLVQFLGNIPDDMVTFVLAGAKALIMPGIEDFGLTSLETQALGKPVIAYQEGGALETVIDGKTGIFFDKQEINSLVEAVTRFNGFKYNQEDCKNNARKFSRDNFIKNFEQAVFKQK